MQNAHVVAAKVLPYNCMMISILKQTILKKLSIVLNFFLCLSFLTSHAQYNFKPKREYPILLGTSAVFGASLYLQSKVKPLSIAEINQLNASDINRFDRYACTQWNTNIKTSSDVLAAATVLLPAYFILNKNTRAESFKIVNVSVQSFLTAQTLANVFKFTKRNRPYLYNSNVELSEKLKSDSRMSFFSAHTTTVASTCFSFAFAHKAYFPNSKANPYILSSAFVIPAIEGVLRVKAGKHFPTDVITGYLVGLGSAWLMHKVHLNP